MRAYTLSNGSLMVCVDDRGHVRDVYFPHVGLENHVSSRVHRVGVHVDGMIAWLNDSSWNLTTTAAADTMMGIVEAHNDRLGIDMHMRDVVYNEKDVFVREVTITNRSDYERSVKLFFGHEFQVGNTSRGDTGYYDPRNGAIVHYEGRRMFMMRAEGADVFDQYTLGNFGIEGKEGSFRDADDGELSGNPIEHSTVDSIMRVHLTMKPRESHTVYYWLAAARYPHELHELSLYIRQKTPAHLMRTATDYWKAWLSAQGISLAGLAQPIVDLFNRSLITVHAHVDREGSIIASADSDILNQGRDTYAFSWPRDASYAIRALILAGDTNAARQFLTFCAKTITPEGYFMQKYLADGSVGSSWHPWVRNGKPELPIQEDETAIVLIALRDYYTVSRDIEFVETHFNDLIRKPADFMVWYRDLATGLPTPSYELWESQRGVSTYTCATVYAALQSARFFARLLGKVDLADKYQKAADEVRTAILAHLYDAERGAFYKLIAYDADGASHPDRTVDASSAYGIFAFGVLPVDDPRVASAMKLTEDTLLLQHGVGGMTRFEHDAYYRIAPHVPSNPWFVTTLWRAQYYLKKSTSVDDLAIVREILEWCTAHAASSGVLAEQIDPYTGSPIGATPLVWSHAEFITTTIEYIQKLDDFGQCTSCYPLRRTKSYE